MKHQDRQRVTAPRRLHRGRDGWKSNQIISDEGEFFGRVEI
jgi:hypothetical protein